MNRKILTLHRWLGLLAGVFLFLIGASGSLLVYNNALEHWFNPGLYQIKPTGNRLPVDTLYKIVYKKHGHDFSALSFDMPASADEVYEFTFTRQQNFHSRDAYIVDIDPYSGRIVREGNCDEISTSFMHWLMYFHDSFHFGKIGMLIVTLASLSILLSIVTGLIIYRKNIFDVMMFRLPLKTTGKLQRYRSIHIYIGVWALAFNTIVFFTGFWMVKSTLSPASWKSDQQKNMFHLSASIDSCIAKSREVFPGFEPDFISITFNEHEPIEIDGNMTTSAEVFWGDANYVMFDTQSGNSTEIKDLRKASFLENMTAAFWQLHKGGYGGGTIKILYVLGGLTPGTLSITGCVLWWRRRKTPIDSLSEL